MSFCLVLTEISAQEGRKLMLSSETLNSWFCSIDHLSFLNNAEGSTWEDGWVWHGLFSVCYPACTERSPGFSAVCYNCVSDRVFIQLILSSTLSLRCPLHCDLVGSLEDSPTDVFLSACPHSGNRLSYKVFRTLPKYLSFFFRGTKA